HDVPVTLLVDGIPHNFGYGRMDIQPIFPMEIERIEVVKGTADPRYGLGNIAGNVNVHTKQGGEDTEARLLTGSFNTYDASIITSHETGHFSQTYFAGYRTSDGYRDHSELKKGAASGKWFYTPGNDRLRIGLIARFFAMDANAPGYLSKSQTEEDPRQAAGFAGTDGGEQENKHGSLHLDFRPTRDLSWSLKIYAQNLRRTRWARWGDDETQAERFSDDYQYGAISTLSYDLNDGVMARLKIDWGLDYMYQNNLERRWTTVDRVRQDGPIRDWDVNKYYWGSYVQADGDIVSWLRLIAALRMDSLGGSYRNRLAGRESDMLDLEYIWQPKVGAVVTPIEGYSAYANWGRTFQLPGTPQLFGQNAAGDPIDRGLTESTNDGWEAGVKLSPVAWLSVRAGYWEMVADDEVRDKMDGTGDYINAGKTNRKGWDATMTVRPHRWIFLWGSYSHTEAIYTDPGPGLEDRQGKNIENIPDYTAKMGVDVEHPIGIFSSVWLESQGKYYLDPQNVKQKVGDFDLWNLSVGYKTRVATLGMEVKNLLDENYTAFAWNDDHGFSPGDARSFYGWICVAY
ncbi:MAG: TonB-dependent receptor, partial [Desulfatitalea sp.]|nr:TonB-dependent receptor [Desulfatitalea sp.]NNK02854.1 TonB-dependent receptor [Desulfatitalea sp.]